MVCHVKYGMLVIDTCARTHGRSQRNHRTTITSACATHNARIIHAGTEDALTTRVPELERSRGFKAGTLESAAVLASAAQGEVLALVGGQDPAYAGFNRALEAVRPIGSLIKPGERWPHLR